MSKRRVRSSFLVFLMLSSVLIALVGPASPVMANNETTSGTITTSETWSGTHQLTGDITIGYPIHIRSHVVKLLDPK